MKGNPSVQFLRNLDSILFPKVGGTWHPYPQWPHHCLRSDCAFTKEYYLQIQYDLPFQIFVPLTALSFEGQVPPFQ